MIDRGTGKEGMWKKGGSEKKRQRSGKDNCTKVICLHGSQRVDTEMTRNHFITCHNIDKLSLLVESVRTWTSSKCMAHVLEARTPSLSS